MNATLVALFLRGGDKNRKADGGGAVTRLLVDTTSLSANHGYTVKVGFFELSCLIICNPATSDFLYGTSLDMGSIS